MSRYLSDDEGLDNRPWPLSRNVSEADLEPTVNANIDYSLQAMTNPGMPSTYGLVQRRTLNANAPSFTPSGHPVHQSWPGDAFFADSPSSSTSSPPYHHNTRRTERRTWTPLSDTIHRVADIDGENFVWNRLRNTSRSNNEEWRRRSSLRSGREPAGSFAPVPVSPGLRPSTMCDNSNSNDVTPRVLLESRAQPAHRGQWDGVGSAPVIATQSMTSTPNATMQSHFRTEFHGNTPGRTRRNRAITTDSLEMGCERQSTPLSSSRKITQRRHRMWHEYIDIPAHSDTDCLTRTQPSQHRTEEASETPSDHLIIRSRCIKTPSDDKELLLYQDESMSLDPGDSGPEAILAQSARCIPPSAGAGVSLLYRTVPTLAGTDNWRDIRDIQRAPVQYVPISASLNRHENSWSNDYSPRRDLRDDLAHNAYLVWPLGEVPGELFAEIASYLSRDDIKAMRLTCKEFEIHVSHALFSTVVVPFNTEIYGMLEANIEDTQLHRRLTQTNDDAILSDGKPIWKNAKADHIYAGHGIDVFRGFGPHIRRYGMSFEVDEGALARPPTKNTQEVQKSYWGIFPWPYQEYRRFERTADLEIAADETPKMKQAFSFLERVRELALSIDSGLGWLKGPDISIRTQVLGVPTPIFNSRSGDSDCISRAQIDLWRYLRAQHGVNKPELRHVVLQRAAFNFSDSEFERLTERHMLKCPSDVSWLIPQLIGDGTTNQDNSHVWGDELVTGGLLNSAEHTAGQRGLLYTTESSLDDLTPKRGLIVPNSLTKPQKEWLLETEWAQCAFLSSYMIAIIDNPVTFQNVHTLNLARMSSRYLHMLGRIDFWESLPSLHNVKIMVQADWRDVRKDPAGFVEAPAIPPSSATDHFHRLLNGTIANVESIRHLTLGWACGGENAEGVAARNKHLLPAPFLPPAFLDDNVSHARTEAGIVSFPSVEHLVLVNSWITPVALTAFVKKHQAARLEKLTLESISLTAPGRTNNGPNQVQQGIQNAIAQLIQNMHATTQAAPPNANGGGVAGQPMTTPLQLATHLQNLQGHVGAGGVQQIAQGLGQAGNPAFQNMVNTWLQAQNAGGGDADAAAGWGAPPREGSWPWVLDIISPGKNLSDFHFDHSNADNVRAASSTLAEVELVSCGYAKVFSPSFDNSQLDAPVPHTLDTHFQKRYQALSPCMMKSADTYLGEIVPYVPPSEASCLQTVWNCTMGWEDADRAEEATFDGALPGGTGRFGGSIRRSDRDELEVSSE